MNIDKEFEHFFWFPEGSDRLTVTSVSAKLFAGHCVAQVEQEHDQLKVALEIVTSELESWKATEEDPDSIRAIQIGKQAIRDCKGLSLDEHDAQVTNQYLETEALCRALAFRAYSKCGLINARGIEFVTSLVDERWGDWLQEVKDIYRWVHALDLELDKRQEAQEVENA